MRARILAFSILLTVSFVSCKDNQQTGPAENSIPAPVRTAHVQREERVLEIAGTIRSADVAQLASRFAGFISRVPARAGDHVKKGQVLVLLDDRNLSAQRERISAGKEEAQQSVEAAAAQKRLAFNTFERIKALYEKKSAGKQEYEEAESRKDAAEATYQAALKRVAQTESEMKDVRASSDYLRITAPFEGIITNVSVDAGTFVNPGQAPLSLALFRRRNGGARCNKPHPSSASSEEQHGVASSTSEARYRFPASPFVSANRQEWRTSRTHKCFPYASSSTSRSEIVRISKKGQIYIPKAYHRKRSPVFLIQIL